MSKGKPAMVLLLAQACLSGYGLRGLLAMGERELLALAEAAGLTAEDCAQALKTLHDKLTRAVRVQDLQDLN